MIRRKDVNSSRLGLCDANKRSKGCTVRLRIALQSLDFLKFRDVFGIPLPLFFFWFCKILVMIFSNSCPDFFSSDFFKTLDVLSLRHFDLHFRGICGRVEPGKIKKIYFRTWLELRTIQDQIYTRIPWKFIWKYLRRGSLCFDSKLCDVNNENIAIWPQRPTSYNKLHKYLAVN